MIQLTAKKARNGITLFEVVVAMAIFTLTLPALISLIQMGALRALQASNLAKASIECRSKLAELTVGAESLDSADWTPLQDANWYWKSNVTGGAVEGLHQVQVSVKYDDGSAPVQVTLSQIIIDPANRGSTQDRAILAALSNGAMPSTDPAADPAATDPAAGTDASSGGTTPAATPPTGGTTPASGSKTGAGTGGGGRPTGGGGTGGGGAGGGGGQTGMGGTGTAPTGRGGQR